MSRKIIGVTVGTQLPKPNFKQTDPTKGDYIKNKPDFEGLKSKVDGISELVGNTPVDERISAALQNKADLVDGKIPTEQLPDDIGGNDVDLSDYYTKSEVDTALENVNVDLSNYYTKPEADQALAAKADLVDGKIPASQLPIDLGGDGNITVEGVSSWNDLEDKPFYDNRLTSYYSYEKNPNPVSFTHELLGYSFYKVSDLILTKEQIVNDMQINITVRNGTVVDATPAESAIFIETDDMIATNDGEWGFLFTNKAGTLPFTYNGYSLSVDVPEAGIYAIFPLNVILWDNIACEVLVNGEDFKQIEPKYIPDMYYDTRVRSYYSQAETPDPVSFDNEMMQYSFYKISDLVPTREQIFGEMKMRANGRTIDFIEDDILIEADEFIAMSTGFLFANTAGEISFTYSGYPMVVEVPEVGIYSVQNLGVSMPDGVVIEIELGGELKQIDPKFIPEGLVGSGSSAGCPVYSGGQALIASSGNMIINMQALFASLAESGDYESIDFKKGCYNIPNGTTEFILSFSGMDITSDSGISISIATGHAGAQDIDDYTSNVLVEISGLKSMKSSSWYTIYCIYIKSMDKWAGTVVSSAGSDYELPVATPTTLGGIKVGNNLTIDNGVLSANIPSLSWTDITGKPSLYTQSEVDTKLNNKQSISNLVTSIDENSTDLQYPSAKLLYDLIGDCNAVFNEIDALIGD